MLRSGNLVGLCLGPDDALEAALQASKLVGTFVVKGDEPGGVTINTI
ncbi:MAG: hypothetical protein ABI808_12440 [Pseudonocardiales bacterium]